MRKPPSHDEFFKLDFASRRYGAYLEKLAPFRPIADMEARLDVDCWVL